MSVAPNHPIRPTPGRIAAIVACGPAIGTAALFLTQAILKPPPELPTGDVLPTALFLLGFGYMFGLLAAALSAAGYSHFYRHCTTRWRQFFICLAIGAVSGGIGVLLPMWMFAGSMLYEPGFMALSAIAGAVALPLAAMPFSKVAR